MVHSTTADEVFHAQEKILVSVKNVVMRGEDVVTFGERMLLQNL